MDIIMMIPKCNVYHVVIGLLILSTGSTNIYSIDLNSLIAAQERLFLFESDIYSVQCKEDLKTLFEFQENKESTFNALVLKCNQYEKYFRKLQTNRYYDFVVSLGIALAFSGIAAFSIRRLYLTTVEKSLVGEGLATIGCLLGIGGSVVNLSGCIAYGALAYKYCSKECEKTLEHLKYVREQLEQYNPNNSPFETVIPAQKEE